MAVADTIETERITDGLLARAKETPEAIALTLHTDQPPLQFSYRTLLQRVHNAADLLASRCQNVQATSAISLPARRLPPFQQPWVALLLADPVELLTYFWATVSMAGVAMVLNPDWSLEHISSILRRWPPEVLVTDAANLDRLRTHDVWSDLQRQGIGAIALLDLSLPLGQDEDCSQAHCCVELDAAAMPLGNGIDLEALHLDQPTPPAFCPRHLPSHELPFYIGFTSGTTGQPKGMIRHHASWLHSFRVSRAAFGVSPDEVVLVPGNLVHSLSLYSAVEALAHGAHLHLLSRFHPKLALQPLTDNTITRIVAVPTLLGAIARAGLRRNVSFSSVRSILSAGTKLSSSLREQLQQVCPDATVMEYYGASELSFVSVAASSGIFGDAVPEHSVGRPFPTVKVGVFRATGESAPPGEIGQIRIQSDMICSGYLDPTDGTGFRIENGWATVGDRGWLDEQGFLYLAGREGNMLICNGVNVYPAEVEAVLAEHVAVEEAVVLGIPDDCRGDRLCAVVKLDEAQRCDRSQLMRYLQSRLEPAKCPRQWIMVEQFPLTSSGKIHRSALLKQVLNQRNL